MKKLLILALTIVLPLNLSAQEQIQAPIIEEKPILLNKINPDRFKTIAKIQILDKSTAKSVETTIKTGQNQDYGNINIQIHKCWQAPLDKKPDSKILITVTEKTPITTKKRNNHRIFHGWMIASSPSISGLQHPVYDIVALKCFNPEKPQISN